ncbi:MAG TPA: RidA family protein [Ilumatobacteraceae bacterium]|nr:RidA family protein [Ilumatobacteraceae bacterium]
MADWEHRLEELGIQLRDPLPAGGLYTSVVVVDGFAYTSGTVGVDGPPWRLAHPGCLGDDLDLETGQSSARKAMISLLGNLRGGIGTLDRVERFVKITGFVRAVPAFTDVPKVMDGASQLLVDIFGQPCARSAIGVSALPGGASVEIDSVVKLAW